MELYYEAILQNYTMEFHSEKDPWDPHGVCGAPCDLQGAPGNAPGTLWGGPLDPWGPS